MNKIKIFFRNLGRRIKSFIFGLYRRSYGMDDLNKSIIISYFALSLINLILRTRLLSIITFFLFIAFIFRYFSSNKNARAEENRKFRKLSKYLKLKWTYRKTHRIFMCKNCKQIIRLPKGQGKIESTCPTCGKKEVHRT